MAINPHSHIQGQVFKAETEVWHPPESLWSLISHWASHRFEIISHSGQRDG